MAIQRVSTNASGQQADGNNSLGYGGSYSGRGYTSNVFSPDGRQIVFSSSAPDIAGSDRGVIVQKSLIDGSTRILSTGLEGATSAVYSPDGSTVVFTAYSGPAGSQQTEVYETKLAGGGTPKLVSSNASGVAADNYANVVGISIDGQRVAFASSADNLGGSSATQGPTTTYVKDLTTGSTTQVGSNAYGDVEFTSDLRGALIDAYDQVGQRSTVTFQNLTTGASTNVNSDMSGQAGNGTFARGDLLAGGTQVVFSTDSSNLSASAPMGGLFIKSLTTGGLTLVAADSETKTSITDVGTYNGFDSAASNGTIAYDASSYNETIAPDGTRTSNDTDRIFVRTASGAVMAVTPQVSSTNTSKTTGDPNQPTGGTFTSNGSSFQGATLSADGSKIAYIEFTANNLTNSYDPTTGTSSGSGSSTTQAFVYDLTTGRTVAISDPGSNNFVTIKSFSPDASKVLYTVYNSSGSASQTTYVADTATGSHSALPVTNFGDVFFSPDSRSVAYSSDNAGLVPNDTNNATDVFVQTVCFASGTRLLTPEGERAVEHLAVGDRVVTASGEQRPVRWLGHRNLDCTRHPRPSEVMPIRIRADAFGEGRPARDLLVSPGHAVCIDILGEVLVPAGVLVNGATIVQESVGTVTYWHVELDEHDIVLAEGLPCESYLDMGNRGFFAETAVPTLHGVPDAAPETHAGFCRPFHGDGDPLVAFVHERLLARARDLGWQLSDDALAGLHLEVDGTRVRPNVRGLTARFLLPTDAREVWLVADTVVPAHIGAGGDRRSLGLCLGSVTVDDGFGAPRTFSADDPVFEAGFHVAEEGPQRWTVGRARLDPVLWEGCQASAFLRIDLARPCLPRWRWTKDRGAGIGHRTEAA